MSSLSQCANGHFYDSDIYPSCPYCNDMSVRVESGTATKPLMVSIPTEPVKTETKPGTVPPAEFEDDGKTTIVKNGDGGESNEGVRYVVGWLAAIDGPYKGKSFELHYGYNRVGRKEGDIKLEKDGTISRADHFRIVYDEEDNIFLFFAGDSDNYPRVNGQKRYGGERAELKPYSRIDAGNSKFMFVPLCTDEFSWVDQGK